MKKYVLRIVAVIISFVCVSVILLPAGVTYAANSENWADAYLNVLADNQDSIGIAKADDEDLTKFIAIENIAGDTTPELIFMTVDSNNGTDTGTDMHIWSMIDGSAAEILMQKYVGFDIADGHDFFAYIENGVFYLREDVERLNTYELNGDKLIASATTPSNDEWKSFVGDVASGKQRVLIHSAYSLIVVHAPGNVERIADIPDATGYTYDEAIEYLTGEANKSTASSSDSTTVSQTETSTGPTATPTSSKVFIDGEERAFEAFNINDYNYFKLRDLAFALSGSEKQFDVSYDNEKNAITLTSGRPYTVVGDEMSGKGDGAKIPSPTSSEIYINGEKTTFTAYSIGGNNYFKLRDIGAAFDFSINLDNANNIIIDTSAGYVSPDEVSSQSMTTPHGIDPALLGTWHYTIDTPQGAMSARESVTFSEDSNFTKTTQIGNGTIEITGDFTTTGENIEITNIEYLRSGSESVTWDNKVIGYFIGSDAAGAYLCIGTLSENESYAAVDDIAKFRKN